MNRNDRKQLGSQTLEIVDRGWYDSEDGSRVDFSRQIATCLETTQLYTPPQLMDLLTNSSPGVQRTEFEVENETTLSAARRHVVEQGHGKTLCLNFASAKNPGGGFLGGSQAQEESLARSSALYASLLTQDTYYEMNRGCRTALYTDYLILSPDVPVFRKDDGSLLPEPYRLSIVTSPAVNAGSVRRNEPEKEPAIRPTMATRIAMVLAVAAHRGYEHLVLGAWGCGVFGNIPDEIAELFAAALLDGGTFHNQFSSLTFAVLDRTRDQEIIRPFRQHFAPESRK